jgi:hypothetical protein
MPLCRYFAPLGYLVHHVNYHSYLEQVSGSSPLVGSCLTWFSRISLTLVDVLDD